MPYRAARTRSGVEGVAPGIGERCDGAGCGGGGLERPLAGGGPVWNVVQLATTALLGALVYDTTLLLAWLASWRPREAELYLRMVRQAIRFG